MTVSGGEGKDLSSSRSPSEPSPFSPRGVSIETGSWERVEHLQDLVDGQVHPAGQLVGVGQLAALLDRGLGDLLEPVDGLGQMDRDADRPALVGDGPGDRLADPPGRVGRELVAAPVVELLGGPHQADVAFLDEVEELEAAALVLLGDGDDQPQVGRNEVALGPLPGPAAGLDGLQDGPVVLAGLLGEPA